MKKESKKLPHIAEVELIYNNHVPSAEKKKIANSKDAYEIFKAHWNFDTIELYAKNCNTKVRKNIYRQIELETNFSLIYFSLLKSPVTAKFPKPTKNPANSKACRILI